MKIPIDELNVVIRQDGLVVAMYPRGAVLEQLLPQTMVEDILRAPEAEGQAQRAPLRTTR
jgi:hypothetical protein